MNWAYLISQGERQKSLSYQNYQSLKVQRYALMAIGLLAILPKLFGIGFLTGGIGGLMTIDGFLFLILGCSGVYLASYHSDYVQKNIHLFTTIAIGLFSLISIYSLITNNYPVEFAYAYLIIASVLGIFLSNNRILTFYLASFLGLNFLGLIISNSPQVNPLFYSLCSVGLAGFIWLLKGTYSDNLENRERLQSKLHDYAKLYEKVFLASPSGVAILDENLHFIDVNVQFCEMLGFQAEDLHQQTAGMVWDKNDVIVNTEILKSLFNQNLEHYQSTIYFKKKNGELSETDTDFSLIKNRKGESLYVVIVAEEQFEIKRIAEEKKTSKLIPQSEHIDPPFASVFNEDFQQKVSELSNMIGFLDRRMDSEADGASQRMMTDALEYVKEVKYSVDHLTEYLQIEKQPVSLERLNVDHILNQSKEEIKPLMLAAEAIITQDSLPFIMYDAEQLNKVFKELFRNAIYRAQSEQPHIHINVLESLDHWVFELTDNGSPIVSKKETETPKPKGAFGKDFYENSDNLGLAICEKIVTLNGGKIGFEVYPDGGNRVYFTVAK